MSSNIFNCNCLKQHYNTFFSLIKITYTAVCRLFSLTVRNTMIATIIQKLLQKSLK